MVNRIIKILYGSYVSLQGSYMKKTEINEGYDSPRKFSDGILFSF